MPTVPTIGVEEARQQLQETGLPAAEIDILRAFGWNDQKIAELLGTLVSMDAQYYTTVHSLPEWLVGAADSLDELVATLPPPDPDDQDADANSDDVDNCPSIFNPDQADVDEDGVGDACEPVADAGVDQIVECSATDGTSVTLIGSNSISPTGGALSYLWSGPFLEGGGVVAGLNPTVTLPLGTHQISLVVTDELSDSEPDVVELVVHDTAAPSLTIGISPETLWPPNHNMVGIATSVTAIDVCDPAPSVQLVNISMDEGEETLTYDPLYDETIGDGHTTDDIEVGEDGSISLRAERAGKGDGRVYTLTFEATDASGNSASVQATVDVPHSQ